MSDPHSSQTQTQRKQWRMRNSDGKFCLDEYGQLVACQAPPSWTLTDEPLPYGAQTILHPEDNEYTARTVKHTHVFDPSLRDPDD